MKLVKSKPEITEEKLLTSKPEICEVKFSHAQVAMACNCHCR